MKHYLTLLFILSAFASHAQKKVLDHADFDIWNTIENESISATGDYVMYALEKGERDNTLKIKTGDGKLIFEHERSVPKGFTYDGTYAIFTIEAWQDSVREMKRRKVKKDDLPKDSLGIYDLKNKTLVKIPFIQKYGLPEKWSGYIAYQLTEIPEPKKDEAEDDASEEEAEEETENKDKAAKPKKANKENGYHMVVRNLTTNAQDTFKYVTKFTFAEEGEMLAFTSTGVDSTFNAGVYTLDLEDNKLTNVLNAEEGKFPQLSWSRTGKHLGFVADLDTTKVQIRPHVLYHWTGGQAAASQILDASTSPSGMLVSGDRAITFSEDESRLFFGLAPMPILQDTTLLEEEIVNVEVWTYDEPRLYTVQELQADDDRKKSYLSAIELDQNNKLSSIGSETYPNAMQGNQGDADVALLNRAEPYQLESQWRGGSNRDYAIADMNTGTVTQILTDIRSRANLSPMANYVFGYSSEDSTWFTYDVAQNQKLNLTQGAVFFDEENDSPNYPSSYGLAGWTADDASIILYDRYDLWEFNPKDGTSTRLTQGREQKMRYRYVKLDPEERFLDPKASWLLTTFDETSKHSGYYSFNKKNGKGKQLLEGPFTYSRPVKARTSKNVMFTRQSFEEFPDIRYSDLTFSSMVKISDANPQQSEYNWGTAELVDWVSLDGEKLHGMLIKPEDFDPNKEYPMLVNFYETSSDGLYRHRAPSPGRSTINYSFYASRGYLIFNPDVHYRIGYPGESAYNCVIPGVTSLIEKGFVDEKNIGVQGHSWGGYQIAYLVTKTDIFKAAEAGAPVPNMISAYGGIRWWTGLSRQFQYEHTQSRIAGTPWDYPVRYIENSPIFFVDKINTPLLIMHNDADGHVPWYQGIEFFTALRRLGKPSWFLNYNGEPHWPLKIQNRKDFNIRMAQFFDYYLKGAPMPVWMDRGVPAVEKGINQGYELIK
jgi:dipeptidyl aminopeptidase/acylaminoacyl peptidase